MTPRSNQVSVRARGEGKILDVNITRDFNDDNEF